MVAAPAIRVHDLAKRYRLGGHSQAQPTLREALMSIGRAPLKALRRRREASAERSTFWALEDVSFDVMRGDAVGVIGRNGAGKSTLLKILSRITFPTRGRVELFGRVASLLEVGTGFHPELTGRENIFLNGAVLGMRRGEIQRKFDEIVAFAEVERFLDTQVKHYSSGMQMRLAFAVAAHLDPEILLIDEVLAVGDAAFQKKCLGKMDQVARSGRTVLFVSHQMSTVSRLCSTAIWLDHGRFVCRGPAREVIARYVSSGAHQNGECVWPEGYSNPGVDEFKVRTFRLLNEHDACTSAIESSRPFRIEVQYRVEKPLPYCRIGFLLNTADGLTVLEAYDADNEQFAYRRLPGEYTVRCEIPGNLLAPGQYSLSLNAGIYNVKNLVWQEGLLEFAVEDVPEAGATTLSPRGGLIRPKLHWELA